MGRKKNKVSALAETQNFIALSKVTLNELTGRLAQMYIINLITKRSYPNAVFSEGL
jgi:hypothetical protein